MDFLWHEVTEEEKEDIRKQANKIIDDFSKQLSKVKLNEDKPIINKDKFLKSEIKVRERSEDANSKPLKLNKEIMFENAPEKSKDSIIAEKKIW
ncbi:MAG TPA: hypothetical protein VJB35_05135 [Candidatus Nanoarchaeia archaeon]|nr:hypothetical protein [Candidatus Nanoarchaeia archaeon]